MVIKVYISSVSGNMEMRHQQQHIQMVLDGKKIDYELVDIADPSNDEQKKFMRANARAQKETRVPLPPQIFSDEDYIGAFDEFSEAVECERLFDFLKRETPESERMHEPTPTPEVADAAEQARQEED